MSVIVIPVKAPEDPRCPHCDRRLPGWSPPLDGGFGTFVFGLVFFISLLFFITGLLFGPAERYNPDQSCLLKYFDYSPKYVGCQIHKFLGTSVK